MAIMKKTAEKLGRAVLLGVLVVGLLLMSAWIGRSAATPAATQQAELVLMNGKIITVDSKDTIAQAVAVREGNIVRVGKNEDVKALIGQQTKVLDLKGKTVTPGLIDTHNHIAAGIVQLPKYFLDLMPGKVQSISDIVKLVAKKAEETPKGEWIQGNGWWIPALKEKRWPTRHDLDPVSPNHPVYLIDMSGWYGCVNSYALKVSGITEKTPDPPGGVLDRDATGNLTGVLLNHAAMWLIKRPAWTIEQFEEAIKYGIQLFLAEGVTSIYDNNIANELALEAYQRLDSRGELRARMNLYWLCTTETGARRSLAFIKPFEGTMAKFKGWKLQTDGAGATALTYEPYEGMKTHTVAAVAPGELKRMVSMLHRSGLQLSIHVVGDKALDVTLDAYEAALKENPRPDHRHRLEHITVSPKPGALERVKSLGLVINIQPTLFWCCDMLFRMIGSERSQMSTPAKTVMDMGIPVALGSDYPCTPDTRPQRTLWVALTRQTMYGTVIGPQERVTMREALWLHTTGSAYAAHEENVKGSIEEGKLGDMVVWSHDMYSMPTNQLLDLKAEITIVGGRIVYEREEPLTTSGATPTTRITFEVTTWLIIIVAVGVPVAAALLWLQRRAGASPRLGKSEND